MQWGKTLQKIINLAGSTYLIMLVNSVDIRSKSAKKYLFNFPLLLQNKNMNIKWRNGHKETIAYAFIDVLVN